MSRLMGNPFGGDFGAALMQNGYWSVDSVRIPAEFANITSVVPEFSAISPDGIRVRFIVRFNTAVGLRSADEGGRIEMGANNTESGGDYVPVTTFSSLEDLRNRLRGVDLQEYRSEFTRNIGKFTGNRSVRPLMDELIDYGFRHVGPYSHNIPIGADTSVASMDVTAPDRQQVTFIFNLPSDNTPEGEIVLRYTNPGENGIRETIRVFPSASALLEALKPLYQNFSTRTTIEPITRLRLETSP